ncbi:TonB-dependent siderophore receptor [Ereboglobus luteus]|nr:TonB-dependent receptor [Ereboglobus luteus]
MPNPKKILAALLIFPCAVFAQEAPVVPDDDDDIVVLSPFEVREDANGGYAATNAVSGTRLNTNLLELPKTVDVVTSDFIKDIGAIDMAGALQYTPGVVLADDNVGSDDAYGGRFSIRGIQTNTSYRNGFPSSFIVDPVLIDRIEIIKGPSSTFSGPIEPGGTRNYITRKPPGKSTTSLFSRYESFSRFRAQIVNGGPLKTDKSLSYRIAGVYEDFDSYQDFANRKRHVGAGTLLWKISSKATLQTDFQYVRSEVIPSTHTGIFTLVNGERTYQDDIPREFNRQGPEAFANTTQISSLTDFTYRINHTWTVRAGLIYTNQDVARLLPGTGSQIVMVNGRRAVSRTEVTYMKDAISTAVNPQVYAVGEFKYGKISHKLMLGADFYHFDTKNDIYRKTELTRLFIDDRANNDYSLGNPADYDEFNLRRTLHRYKALSMNNIIQFFGKRLTIMQALRYTHLDDIAKNDMVTAANPRVQDTQSNWVQSYGASLKILPDMSVFLSYSQSFNPQALFFTYEGNMLKPLKGRGWDVGVKYDIIKNKLSSTLTAYDLKQNNAMIADFDHSGYYLNSGETKSRGVEFTLQAHPVKPWQATLGYSYIDAEIVTAPASRPERLGRVANIPKHQLTLWNHYRISNGALKGLAGGLGVVYMSARRTHATLADQPGIEAPGYTKLDLSISYSFKLRRMPVTLRGEVNNLTDEKYFSAYNYYGMPRTYSGSLELRF